MQETSAQGLSFSKPVHAGAAFALLAMTALALSSCRERTAAPEPAAAQPAPAVTNTPAPAGGLKPQYQKLIGRWLREDGGYVLEIGKIDPDGKVEAGYFNPNSIHVSKAEIKDSAGATRLFVELRDAGYPGCTYNLVFDPAGDSLVGIYFQAAMRQEYSVIFVRQK